MTPYQSKLRMLDAIGGDEALLCTVARMFLADLPTSLARLQVAVDSRDRDALHSIAHSLKGTAATLGAERALRAATTIERCCRSGDLEAAVQPARELADAIRGLAREIRSDPDLNPAERRLPIN